MTRDGDSHRQSSSWDSIDGRERRGNQGKHGYPTDGGGFSRLHSLMAGVCPGAPDHASRAISDPGSHGSRPGDGYTNDIRIRVALG